MIRNVEYNLKPSRFCGFQPTINSPIDVNKLYSPREYSLRYERNLCEQQRGRQKKDAETGYVLLTCGVPP
jgi:hypothetical protein